MPSCLPRRQQNLKKRSSPRPAGGGGKTIYRISQPRQKLVGGDALCHVISEIVRPRSTGMVGVVKAASAHGMEFID